MTAELSFCTGAELYAETKAQIKHLEPLWTKNLEENRPKIKHFVEELPRHYLQHPAIVVGAGWTLDRDLPVIKNTKAHLICTDKAFPKVNAWRAPEYVTAVNTEAVKTRPCIDGLLNKTSPDEWLVGGKNTKLIVPVTIHPECYKNWEGEIYWMIPDNTSPDFLETVKDIPTAPMYRGENAGVFAYLMGAYMTYSPIGLIAMNYCWEKMEGIQPNGTDRHYVKMQGYNGNFVYTTLGWLESRVDFLGAVEQFSTTGLKTFNLSEEGILASHPNLPVLRGEERQKI